MIMTPLFFVVCAALKRNGDEIFPTPCVLCFISLFYFEFLPMGERFYFLPCEGLSNLCSVQQYRGNGSGLGTNKPIIAGARHAIRGLGFD